MIMQVMSCCNGLYMNEEPMKKSDKHRNWWTAITFAEAGEWDTAREFMPLSPPRNEISRLQKIFAAVALAEEGLHEDAVQLLDDNSPGSPKKSDFLDAIGLRGARVTYGILPAESA
jgi:hypothetical protein